MKDRPMDWDMTDDYYKEPEDKRELILEDFILKDEISENRPTFGQDEKFEKTVSDIKNVKEASAAGKNIEQISVEFGLEQDYITNILMTVQGYPEDDDRAIAHLILI